MPQRPLRHVKQLGNTRRRIKCAGRQPSFAVSENFVLTLTGPLAALMTSPWHGALPRELHIDMTLHHAAPRSMPARTLRQGGRSCHPGGSLRPQSFRRYQQRGCNMHSTSNIKLNAASARCSPWLTFSGAHVTVDSETFIGWLPRHAAEPRSCVTQLKGFESAGPF